MAKKTLNPSELKNARGSPLSWAARFARGPPEWGRNASIFELARSLALLFATGAPLTRAKSA